MRYRANNFTIETPDDWQDRSIISFAAPVSPHEFAPNVVITKEKFDDEMSVEEYCGIQLNIAVNEIPGLKILKREDIKIGGKPAVEILQRFSAHELNLQQLQIFVVIDAEICVITCTAAIENFNQVLPRFRKMLDSFRVDR